MATARSPACGAHQPRRTAHAAESTPLRLGRRLHVRRLQQALCATLYLRRTVCPNPECGPGTFMANHFDRRYCGKCGLTYMSGPGDAPEGAAADAGKGGKKKK